MAFIVSYSCERATYSGQKSKYTTVVVTTEYTHGNDVLIHQRLGKNQGVRLNNLLNYKFKRNINYAAEQFFVKKAYKQSQQRKITRSTFDTRLKQFDMTKTTVVTEIVKDYSYTDKAGKLAGVQIVIYDRGEEMTAVIDFKNPAQYEDFVCPDWLRELT